MAHYTDLKKKIHPFVTTWLPRGYQIRGNQKFRHKICTLIEANAAAPYKPLQEKKLEKK